MKNKMLISFLVLIASFGCIKKEQKVSEEAKVIQLLNNSEAESAMTKVDSLLANDPENENLLYLKASALSMKAGVDVYKLFPLLKVKIFDVAISQWSDQREFERRMRDRREVGDSKDPKAPREYKPLADEKISYEVIEAWENDYDRTHFSAKITSPNIKMEWDDAAYIDIQVEENSDLARALATVGINKKPDYKEKLKLEPFRKAFIAIIKEYHRKQWEDKNKKVNKSQNQVKGIQALWSITDMIPIIKQIPRIESSVLDELLTAQNILTKIIERNKTQKNELYNKARKQLMMISALKIIGRFQAAFNLELINSPNDLTCSSNESTAAFAVDSVPDALLLVHGIDDDNFKEKNDKALIEVDKILTKIKTQMDDVPGYRDELIQDIQKGIEKIKEENCFEDKD